MGDGTEGSVLDGYISTGVGGDYRVEVRLGLNGFEVLSTSSQRWISPTEYSVTPRAVRWRRAADEYVVVRKADSEALVLGVSSLDVLKKLKRFQRYYAFGFLALVFGAVGGGLAFFHGIYYVAVFPLAYAAFFVNHYFQRILIERSFPIMLRADGVAFERFLAASEFPGKELLVDGSYPTDQVTDHRGEGSVSTIQALDPAASMLPLRKIKVLRFVLSVVLSLITALTVGLFLGTFFGAVSGVVLAVILVSVTGGMLYLWLYATAVGVLALKSYEEIDERLAGRVFDSEMMRRLPRWLAWVAPAILTLSLAAVGVVSAS